MCVDYVGCGPWWTSHHDRYRAPPGLSHGPFRAPRTCRDRGESKRMMFCFLLATGRRPGGCSTKKFDGDDRSSLERQRKRGGGELVAKMDAGGAVKVMGSLI
jgi:hypothetical protein